MEAAGEVVSGVDKGSMILDNLLDRFLTGTEKEKTWGNRSRSVKTSQLGPITELRLDSHAMRAKDLKEKNKKKMPGKGCCKRTGRQRTNM